MIRVNSVLWLFLQLISHEGVRSLIGPSEFSMRFVSNVRLRYFRFGLNTTKSKIEMDIKVEPFNFTAKPEYFNSWNYQNGENFMNLSS